MQKCKVCRNPTSKICGRCHDINICSKDCQKKDWLQHRITCEYATKYSNPGHIKFLKTCTVFDDNEKEHFLSDIYKNESPKEIVLKRWGEMSPNLLNFFNNVYVNEKENIFYDKTKLYNPPEQLDFGNAPYKKCDLFFGTTHVSIGIADFGILLNASISELADRIDDQKNPQTNLRFVGYDGSAFIIAKLLIILEMIKSECNVNSIIQVWWSSTWNAKTLEIFKKAFLSLSYQQYSKEVRKILEFWKNSCNISASDAQQKWFSTRLKSTFEQEIPNLQREDDRIEFTRYCLTGTIPLAGEDDQFGNITMFCRPKGVKPQEKNQVFYKQLPINDIITCSTSLNDSLMKILLSWTTESVKLLMKRIQNGEIEVLLRHVFLTENSKEIEEIRNWNPKTIHWSNICDYMSSKNFHTIARNCSFSDTIHLGYSMNWTQEIMGASIIDFQSRARQNIFEDEKERFYEKWKSSRKEIFRSNLLMHPMAMSDTILAIKIRQQWFDKYFFLNQNIQKLQQEHEEYDSICPLDRNHVNLHFKYCYT